MRGKIAAIICLNLSLKSKQACFRLQMQPLSRSALRHNEHRALNAKKQKVTTMSSSEGRELRHRLDVRTESSSFAARPLLLWAFQSSQKQLRAIFRPRQSIPHF